MANEPPGGIPGAATGKYPQYGVKMAPDGSSGQITEAKNEAAKLKAMSQGYLEWFATKKAAEDFVASQKGILGGHLPDPLAGIAGALSAFYHALTDGKMWRSLGWIFLGIALMMAGLIWWIGPSAARSSPAGLARRVLG